MDMLVGHYYPGPSGILNRIPGLTILTRDTTNSTTEVITMEHLHIRHLMMMVVVVVVEEEEGRGQEEFLS